MDIWDWMLFTEIAVYILGAIITVIISIVYLKKNYYSSASKKEKFLDIAILTALAGFMTTMTIFIALAVVNMFELFISDGYSMTNYNDESAILLNRRRIHDDIRHI